MAFLTKAEDPAALISLQQQQQQQLRITFCWMQKHIP